MLLKYFNIRENSLGANLLMDQKIDLATLNYHNDIRVCFLFST
jgi:hypothetical protein